jgi:NADPH:quinone reductase-like Zn-dependent oxidoreductase
MSTFSSFQFTAPGPNFKHEIIHVSKPTPSEGHVVIKNAGVAINPLDAKRVAYNMMIPSFPVGGGFEVSGTIIAIGTGVTNVKTGDEVFATVGPSEASSFGFQEYTVTRAANVALKPAHLSFEEASSLP